MQTHTRQTRPEFRARAVPGRHAKDPRRRILVTALLVGCLVAGSAAAASEFAGATSHAKVHHPTSAVVIPKNPWIY
jgi:hypothetical protein